MTPLSLLAAASGMMAMMEAVPALPTPLPLEGQLLSALVAVAFLAIAVLAVGRQASNPLARPLALMSAVVSAYNLLEVVYSATQQPLWAWLEYFAASLLSVPTLHLFVGFVGMTRKLRLPLRLFSGYFVALAIASLAAFVVPALRTFPGGGAWAVAMLVGILPSFGWAGYLLVRHVRSSEAQEKARARLFVAALLLGVGSMTTDLFAVAGFSVPRLSVGGLVVAGGVVAAIVLKARMFDKVTAVMLVNAAIAVALAVVALLVVFAWAETEVAIYAAGTVLVCLTLVAALRPILRDVSEQRARTEYLATLGRFSEQMAHDLRNPLAAIRGSAQFLQEELAQGRSIDEQGEFVAIILERSDRLERVVGDYQRMGRVEPELARVQLNQLVAGVVADEKLSSGSNVDLVTELAGDLPPVKGDSDLLTYALENVVRNAREAMPEGGEIVAVTERVEGERGERVRVSIRDNGEGMDVRAKERALEDFFTTKSEGSGLGLPFVARVLAAHGGSLHIDSEPRQGTTVTLELPAASA